MSAEPTQQAAQSGSAGGVWHLGSVPYLNAQPLIHGLEARATLAFDVPSRLAQRFHRGEFDAALVPLFEALQCDPPRLVDGVAIGCDGPVKSVLLVHDRPLRGVKTIALDPASRTSNHLLQVLLHHHWKLPVEIIDGQSKTHADARVVIGDPALDLQRIAPPSLHLTDLGAEWKAFTGLPFVFAVWCLAPGFDATRALPAILRDAAVHGQAARAQIATQTPDPAAAYHYLTESIHYPIESSQKQAIATFRDLLTSSGFLSGSLPPPVWL